MMKKHLPFLLLIMFTASCRSAWSEDESKVFYQACLDDAKTWAGSPENAATYCNCVIPKIKAKYPDADEAMKQINLLSTDKDLQACRDSLIKK